MIEKDQVYQAIKPNLDGDRIFIRVKSVTVTSGRATIVTIMDDDRELRLRWIDFAQLHEDMLTKDGKPRRNGYVLVVQP